MTRADLTLASDDSADDSFTSAPSRSFSSRCHSRVRSCTSWSRVRVRSRSTRIFCRGHERGAQQAHLGQPGQPLGVQPVGLGQAGQLPGVGGVHQLHVQPGRLQHVEPDPPVVRRGFHRHELHPVREQPRRQRQDRGHGRGDLLGPRHPPPAVAGGRQPRAHVRLPLRHVDAGDPLIAQLVLLVLHQLRANLLLSSSSGGPPPHRLPSSEQVTRRAARGPAAKLARKPRILTVVLKATEGDPQGQVPAPGLITGSHPTERPASRAARAHPAATPASPAATPATERRRPQPAAHPQPRAKFSRQRDHHR